MNPLQAVHARPVTKAGTSRRPRRLAWPRWLFPRQLAAVAVVAWLGWAPVPAWAETVALTANQTQIARMAPGLGSVVMPVAVDGGASTLLVDIVAPSAAFVTALKLPGGQMVTEANAAQFIKIEGSKTQGPSLLPFSSSGTHYVYRVPVSQPGVLEIQVSAIGSLSTEFIVSAQVLSDSPVAGRLFFNETMSVVGRPVVLSGLVADGRTPLTNARWTTTLVNDAGTKISVAMADDGVGADSTAADGLYSGVFIPTTPGRWRAYTEVEGTAASSGSFARQFATQIEVAVSSASLQGSVSGRGVDSNGNGAIDQVAIDAPVNALLAGPYRLFAQLRNATGQRAVAVGETTLRAGPGTATALVEASTLMAQAMGQGPYTVEQLTLERVEPGGLVPADRKVQLGQVGPFPAFERAPLILTGSSSDQGIDTNGNGRFDQLRVQLAVDVMFAGAYQYSGRLTDAFGTVIDVQAASATFNAGTNALVFLFDGRAIGRSGVSGPYVVDSVLISGRASLASSGPAARTQAYRYTQFEAAARQVADLNDDGLVNCADMAVVKAAFGTRTGQAGFNPIADLVADGRIDVRDLATVARALPIGMRCP